MYDESFMKYMFEKSKSECVYDQYMALSFALQIPGICGRLDIPQTEENTGADNQNAGNLYKKNGKPHDKNLYVAWLRRHPFAYRVWASKEMPFSKLPERIYELRNQVVHEGRIFDEDSKIVLLGPGCQGLITKTRAFIPVDRFCEYMFYAVGSVDNVYMARSCGSMVDWPVLDRRLRVMPKEKYESLERYVMGEYQEFWNAHRCDRELYGAFYDSDVVDIDVIRSGLADKDRDAVCGLTRIEASQLVKVVEDLQVVDERVDRDMRKYISAI